ncbi:SPX domain-containing protein 1-like [Zingiber officinale]|uniref:SPX domain-containing protein 1-like n=1 Tax=Zingiber officinale TaxID=94328 RepID=UPI001C4D379A|nr:SPX domain-containing protein 1-like [Zingiber officinale]
MRKGSDDHLVLNIESGSDHSIAAKSDAKGLVKILKKYDKRTRALIRQPFIEKVSQQPFFTTDLLYKLVKECVAMLDHLFPSNNLSISAECDGQNGVPKPA